MSRKLLTAILLLAVIACNFPAQQAAQQLTSRTATSTAGQIPATSTQTAAPFPTQAPPTPTTTPTITPTMKPVPVSGYVILTDIKTSSPYYRAVEMLAAYRGAPIHTFEESVFELQEELNNNVRFAAVVVEPETLEEGFAFDVYTLAKEMVPGYDTDFAYGFITAANPEDMIAYVQRVMLYENGKINTTPAARVMWRSGEGSISGGEGGLADRLTLETLDILEDLGFSAERFDMDQHTKPETMEALRSASLVYFYAHGAPTMIECGLQCQGDAIMRPDAEELDNARFVFAASCYSASVSTYYNQNLSDVESYNDRATSIDPADSIALAFLRSGALFYVGHMCMWGNNTFIMNTLQTLQEDPSLTTGELLQAYYNQVSGPNIISDSPARDLIGMDNNRFYYAAVILHGDPAVRIIRDPDS